MTHPSHHLSQDDTGTDRPSDYNPLRSLTRLTVGSMLIGLDALDTQMRRWEAEAARQRAERAEELSRPPDAEDDLPPLPPAAPPAPPEQHETARHALIGLLFETQDRVGPRWPSLAELDQNLGRLATPLVAALEANPALNPARQQFEQLVARGEREFNTLVGRGEAEVSRWVARGQQEEARCRDLVQTATEVTAEDTIHQVVTNEEVRELVQQQGVGLLNEVVEELRERAVSTDSYLERLVRSWFGRQPREKLPPPPREVRTYAAMLHPPSEKS